MSTPTTPPPAKPAVTNTEEYFNSSRLKVIGMITAATLAVGALGGIAGVVFDPEPIKNEPSLSPEGGGSVGSSGQASPLGKLKPLSLSALSAGTLPRADSTESPSQVGSVSPGSGGISDSPSDEGSDATSEPSPTDEGDGGDTGGGQAATIAATGVDVLVPSGWEVVYQDDNQVSETDNAGSYATAISTTVDPSTSAGDIIAQNLESLLPGDLYTQLQTGDIQELTPFGSVVSVAGVPYQALIGDNQGSISLAGQMYVGVRQDGTVLVMMIEHLPAEDWEAASEELLGIVDATFGRFGGVG
jgi:hypothetical protein